ncbi:YybH family protein [Amaricoccus sp. W119]|uniref:YybH family protein n=1 Tax=Amaricoccus sp. W119 TaxID=3391833 RepID=UPI0039A51748
MPKPVTRAALARALSAAALILTSPAARAEGPEAEIRAQFDTWAEAFNRRDATSVCQTYAEDLVAVWPGLPDADKTVACARIGEALSDPARDVTYAAEIEEILLAPSGDFAAVRTIWTLGVENAGAVSTSQERRLDILAREADGTWRSRRVIGFPAEPLE